MNLKEPSSPEREQTDNSLRVERQKADDALGDTSDSLDETADSVLEKARSRADAVLAAARSTMDRRAAELPESRGVVARVAQERAAADRMVAVERAEADESLLVERAEHAALLAAEREETDRHLLQERSRADEAVATRDEFLGIVSHDLRNMLGAMIGFAALIASEEARADHSDRVLAYTSRIQRAGGRMNRLIGDLGPVVTEAVDSFRSQAAAKGIDLVEQLAPALPSAFFDSARLLQVLINLLTNAIKFTPRGGQVLLEVAPAGDDILFTVRDTGVGIPGDKLEAIFQRFVQVTDDRRGVGLGLYISQCIVQGHGGKIWVESQLGVGSTFRFTIPSG